MVNKFLLAVFCEICTLFLRKCLCFLRSFLPVHLFINSLKMELLLFSEYAGDKVVNNNLDENGKSQ